MDDEELDQYFSKGYPKFTQTMYVHSYIDYTDIDNPIKSVMRRAELFSILKPKKTAY